MSAPRATLRLQFNRAFTLRDATAAVGAYAALGVSHLYASPLQRARSGSTHGYDVVDYGEIAPDLGGLDALRELVAALRARGMGLVLDIVPNHMAASEENPWWRDVLAHGRASRWAEFFDVDWEPDAPELRGKVLAPFLATPLDDALARIALGADADGLCLEVDGRRYPLAPDSVELVADGADAMRDAGALAAAAARFGEDARRRPARLRELLARQHYVLAHWREAATRINWRRFFDIGDLVALRTDRDAVFDAVHAFVFRLYAEALIDGVRVDHVDGLAEPRRYCLKLREGLERAGAARPAALAEPRAYVVVEKILAADETLPDAWDVDGTTGYDFMDQCGAVLHDADGAAALDAAWRALGGDADFVAAYARPARREMLAGTLAADVDRVARAWRAAAADARDAAPAPAPAEARAAIAALIEQFDAYRSYLEPGRADAADRARLFAAAARACAQAPLPLRDAIRALLADLAVGAAAADAPERSRHLLRAFQQLMPAAAAKAVEDTAFYRYGRLLSRNEVGADPAHLALPREAFHAACAERLARTPDAMLAVATHDHKRGADARARLAVLSEAAVAPAWAALLRDWRAANASLRDHVDERVAPDPIDETMLLQTLIGAWPPDLRGDDADALGAFAARVVEWQRKALREAKRATSWAQPDEAYERACERYARAALDPGAASFARLAEFVERIAPAGALNGLAQCALHLTAPGVPDVYQGGDRWDHSLVDPDNRRPVAPAPPPRERDPATLLRGWRSGEVKRHVVVRLLQLRARHPELFRRGGYRPLVARGTFERHVVAFAREDAATGVVVVVTRFAAALVRDEPRVAPVRWDGTLLDVADATYRDALTGRVLHAAGGRLLVGDILAALPVAALVRIDAAAG